MRMSLVCYDVVVNECSQIKGNSLNLYSCQRIRIYTKGSRLWSRGLQRSNYCGKATEGCAATPSIAEEASSEAG